MMNEKPVRFGFLLLPHFTLTAFSGMLDVLRLASDEGDRSRPIRCDWQIIGESIAPIRSSSGIQVTPSACLGDPTRFDYLVVVGGLLQRPPTSQATLDFIRAAAVAGVTLVGLCTGAFTLMQAGVLDGYRICIHWFHYWDFLERFPTADPAKIVADRLYVFDRRRITCSGGRATIDLAAEILNHHISPCIVQKAVRILQVDDIQRRNAAQSLPPGIQPAAHPVVRRAVLLMEQHISRGLSLDELTDKLGVSGRQLERLFKETVGQSPQGYARGVRLRLAAWMLTNTNKTISAIAMDCGFSGASHFGRVFRSAFHVPPSAWRDRAPVPDTPEPALTTVPDPVREMFPDRREFY
ncbi:MAG: GlxA family transcriptional regulator [Candidimonas sp.]|nr:MAG: GlxA family transcriptional regulator [Candidimonas sp.]